MADQRRHLRMLLQRRQRYDARELSIHKSAVRLRELVIEWRELSDRVRMEERGMRLRSGLPGNRRPPTLH